MLSQASLTPARPLLVSLTGRLDLFKGEREAVVLPFKSHSRSHVSACTAVQPARSYLMPFQGLCGCHFCSAACPARQPSTAAP